MPDPVCSICGGHPQLLHAGPGITINRNPGGSGVKAESRIYTNVTRDKIVEEGDPEAAFLVAAGEGDDVPDEYTHLYREYRKARAAVAEPEPEKADEPQPERADEPRRADDEPDAEARRAGRHIETRARRQAEDK